MDMSLLEAVEELKRKAEKYIESKDYCGAEIVYDEVVDVIIEGITQMMHETKVHEKLCEELALAYNSRGHMKYLQVNFFEAIEDYNEALTFKSRPAAAYYNRGLIHYRLGNFVEAIKDMDSALEIDPNFISAKECKEQAESDILLSSHHEAENKRSKAQDA